MKCARLSDSFRLTGIYAKKGEGAATRIPALPVVCRHSGIFAFTLVEVMMGVAVMAVMLVALYGGFAYAFAQTRVARENVRAIQILQQKMEVVRLYNWDAVNTDGYISKSFNEAFYANSPTNSSTGNFLYSGTVLVTNAPISESYSNNMRMVQIKVSWKSSGTTRSRQMTTFISQYGLQKYVY